jgi:glycosyltransferase involved in cell wall biosynthesis
VCADLSVLMVDPSLYTLPYDDHLCAALTRVGCDVTLTCRVLRTGERFLPIEYPRQRHFYGLSERLRTHNFPAPIQQSIKGLEHLFNMARLDTASASVVHFQWLPVPRMDRMFLRRLRRKLPLVLTVHDTDPYNSSPVSPLQKNGLLEAMNEFDQLIVHTDWSRKRLLDQGIAPSKISVVPHGVLSAPFAPTSKNSTSAGASGNRTTVLLFGKIKPYKGYDTLLGALKLIAPTQRKRLRILIAGEPCMDMAPLLHEIEAAQLNDIIEFRLGFLPAELMPDIFSTADVFAFPYHQIDASGAFFECLPYGKPIIASRVGVFAELLQDRKHGHLVQPGNASELARVLSGIEPTSPIYRDMCESVVTLAKNLRTWDDIAQLTIRVYAKAIDLWKMRQLATASPRLS